MRLYDEPMGSLPEWSDAEKRDAALERLARRLSHPDPLTRQELAVLFLVSHGMHRDDIGTVLHMSDNTVKRHVEMTLLKLDARNSAQAVAKAYRAGLIS